MTRARFALALAPFLSLAAPLAAQEFVGGFGIADFHNSTAESGAFVSGDYLGARDWSLFGFEAGLGATVQVHQEGDIFLGVGLQAQRELRSGWFIEASLMPGLFEEGTTANDLGSTLEFRSLIGVGRELRNGNRVSVALSHISNASIGDRNPGLNALSLRYHIPLQRGF